MPLYRNATPLVALAALSVGLSPATAENIFMFGNSLTAGMSARDLHEQVLADTDNPDWLFNQHTVAGTTLTAHAYKHSVNSLPKIATQPSWDAVTFQPYDRMIYDAQAPRDTSGSNFAPDWGVVDNIGVMTEWFTDLNPDTEFYVYAHWKRIDRIDGDNFNPDFANYDFNAEYDKLYTNQQGFANNESRDFFRQVTEELRETYPEQSFNLIPFGDVLYEVNNLARAGEFGPYDDVEELFRDARHLGWGLPQYMKFATFYATIIGDDLENLDWEIYNEITNAEPWTSGRAQDPVFMAALEAAFRPLNQELVDKVNAVVLDVVRNEPLSGVAAPVPEPTTAGLLALGGMALLRRRRA